MFISKLRGSWKSPYVISLAVIAASLVILDVMSQRDRVVLAIYVIAVALLTLIFFVVIMSTVIKETIRKYTYKKICRINDPNERIPELERHILKMTGPDLPFYDPELEYTPLERIRMQLKATLLFSLAIAHIEKGDYGAALDVCNKMQAIHPIQSVSYPDDEMTYGEHSILLITTCLMCLGRLAEAKSAMAPLVDKEFKNPLARHRVDSYLMSIAINSGDAQEARRLLAQVAPETEKSDQRNPGYGILYELKLHEAMIDKLENKFEDARPKLEEILQNCDSYAIKRQAKQLWEEMFSKPAP